MPLQRFFPRQVVESSGNRWDWALLPLVLALLALLAWGGSQMARPCEMGEALPLSLDVVYLPYCLMRTTLRMFIAMGFSLVFACAFAVLASKYRAAEKVLGLREVAHMFVLGCYTMLRVLVLIAVAAVIWVPIGIWIGMNLRWAGRPMR